MWHKQKHRNRRTKQFAWRSIYRYKTGKEFYYSHGASPKIRGLVVTDILCTHFSPFSNITINKWYKFGFLSKYSLTKENLDVASHPTSHQPMPLLKDDPGGFVSEENISERGASKVENER